tara:strand:- start:133 stop:294 length:162 start_codon:yes stop_codon:yes gene_type:complete
MAPGANCQNLRPLIPDFPNKKEVLAAPLFYLDSMSKLTTLLLQYLLSINAQNA